MKHMTTNHTLYSQVEVEIKHKLKGKKISAKNNNQDPLPLLDNIALDAPSNAAVDKVKNAKNTGVVQTVPS